MNSNLKSILTELYEIDPGLREHEQELIPVLEKLIAHKPDVTPDPAFVEKLRMMLREKASKKTSSTHSQFSIFNFPFPLMPNLSYTVAGALVGVLITGPVVYSLVRTQQTLPATEGGESTALFSYNVSNAGNEAFGDLSQMNVNLDAYGRGGGGMGGDRPQSGGGGGNVAMDATMAPEIARDGDAKMIAPDFINYNLVFNGELPALTAEQVEILKRQKGISSPQIGSILNTFNTGLIDLDSFDNAKVDSMNFYQDAPFGYMFYVNFREGSIALNSNWEKWPHPEMNCRDEACYRRYRININDVPADETLIGIANDFVEEHGFDLSQYGEPEVDNTWRINYESSPDKAQFYIPESARVVYPLLVEGKPVYEEGGAKVGISVSVHVREKKVSDVWGIMDQKYLKSSYDAVTDEAQVRSFLETFGDMNTSWMPEGTTQRTVDITLGTPEIGYMKMYTYENTISDELIVPALIFPVENVPQGEYFYRTSVTVPLAKDLLDNLNVPIDGPRPMPLIMEDVPADAAAE